MSGDSSLYVAQISSQPEGAARAEASPSFIVGKTCGRSQSGLCPQPKVEGGRLKVANQNLRRRARNGTLVIQKEIGAACLPQQRRRQVCGVGRLAVKTVAGLGRDLTRDRRRARLLKRPTSMLQSPARAQG